MSPEHTPSGSADVPESEPAPAPEPAPEPASEQGSASASEPLTTVDGLVQLSFLIQGVLSATGGEHDLSIIQIRLLGILRDRQAGMLELGRHLGLDKSSMTGLVSRAEKRGLVRRAPSPHDGRAVLVSLTPLGHRLTEQCGAEISRRVTALTARLTAAQTAHLTQLATALVQPWPATP